MATYCCSSKGLIFIRLEYVTRLEKGFSKDLNRKTAEPNVGISDKESNWTRGNIDQIGIRNQGSTTGTRGFQR
jgi:hypothetical protein